MTTIDRLSPNAPPFALDHIEFRCWITGGPEPGAERYEWRSVDGLLVVGLNAGNSMFFARYGTRVIGQHYQGLKLAMQAAVKYAVRQRRRAA